MSYGEHVHHWETVESGSSVGVDQMTLRQICYCGVFRDTEYKREGSL